LQTVNESWIDGSAFLDEDIGLSLGLHAIGGIVDPIHSCLDQGPLRLGTLGLEIGHLVKEAR
jgi:hypothetical protein